MALPAVLNAHQPQRGAFLFEGLLAIVVFSIGLLALVSLQAQAIKQTSDAKYRGDAAFYADQIIGQIWADSRANIGNYSFNAPGNSSTTKPACNTPPNAACTVRDWLTALENNLPGATPARQSIVVGANNVVTVTVQWQAAQDTGPHNHVAMAQIRG